MLAGATALAALTPILSIVVLALAPSGDLWAHLAANVLPTALRTTALLLAGVGIVTFAIGAGTAWLVSTFDFPGRFLFTWMLALPLALPTYIAAYIFVELLEPLGVMQHVLGLFGISPSVMLALPSIRSTGGAILVMGLVLYPYVYMAARVAFLARSPDIEDTARMLGAGRWRMLRSLTLPYARPAIAVGLSLALLETLNDIGASEYLGARTLTVSIFTTWLTRANLPGAAQVACLMLAVVLILVVIERQARRARRYDIDADATRSAVRVPLYGWRATLAIAACALPVLLGFALPVLFLIGEVLSRNLAVQMSSGLLRDLWHTVTLAGAAALITVVLGFATMTAGRWHRRRWTALAASLAGIGYAVPGLILALGLLTPLVMIDNALNAAASTLTGHKLGLVVAGSGAAIVIAYVIRFMAIATGFAQAGLARIPAEYDDSVTVARCAPLFAFGRVYVPLLRPSLAGAAIMVFVDSLKELPATLLLRPLNVETLATSIYQHASRGSFEDGALAALLIVMASVVPVVVLTALAERPEHAMHDNAARITKAAEPSPPQTPLDELR